MKKQAIVVLSGGMDSAICLSLAISKWGATNVAAITFDYGQRHATEKKASQLIAQHFKIHQQIVEIPFFNQITSSALLDPQINISSQGRNPNTLVVGRNGLFARLAAIYAHHLGAKHLYMGVMSLEVANSGYRDCSREYFDLMEKILRLDLATNDFWIHTPLVDMTKEESLQLANQLHVLPYLLENTITCYEGIAEYGCGLCPACVLRNQGITGFLKLNPNFSFSYRQRFTMT